MLQPPPFLSLFFFNDTATTEIYTLSLHDALPIFEPTVGFARACGFLHEQGVKVADLSRVKRLIEDRKSTRLNSSHQIISYAVFCLKKKKKDRRSQQTSDISEASVTRCVVRVST